MNALKSHVSQFRVRTDVRAGQGGGYVDGVWYADMSGVCQGTTPPPPPPPPPTQGGGYVNGVWYPDKSGYCG